VYGKPRKLQGGGMEDTLIQFVANGVPVSVRSNHPHLLSALREELNITSPKDGCSPSGQCGCCTVFVNGKAVVSCQTSLEKVAGGEVKHLKELKNRSARNIPMHLLLAVACNVDSAFQA